MNIVVTDLETTGKEPDSEILEIGSYLLAGEEPWQAFHSLVRPTGAIPPEAMAVHHITPEDVADASAWRDVAPQWLEAIGYVDVFCAHNAAFEKQYLTETVGNIPWVCTYKCAMHAWPDAPGFSNQVLRYWLNPAGIVRALANETHRALPDAYVTAFLLRALLETHSIETLIAWSADIAMPPRLMFGKHRGKSWDDAPLDYLDWIVNKPNELDADTRECAARHLKRRTIEPPFMLPPDEEPARLSVTAPEYMRMAQRMIQIAFTVGDLESWWRKEADHRASHGITAGTDAYDELVSACRARKARLSKKELAA